VAIFVSSSLARATFTRMREGTAEEYALIHAREAACNRVSPAQPHSCPVSAAVTGRRLPLTFTLYAPFMVISAAAAVTGLLSSAGAREYLGEPVTVLAHLLQAGSLAEAAGAAPALVAAALLHDVGHLLEASADGEHGGTGLRGGSFAEDGDVHGERAADWLAGWFGPDVTEPVRLHVAAKRYLCGTDPGYYGLLSPASRHTLAVQGGPMTAEQASQFTATPFARQAVLVRRWDDSAKQPGAGQEVLEHFLPLLRQLAGGGQLA
jgi:gamma-butyrobetaine dioxygenase